MKTPEEIKKWIVCCLAERDACDECPYIHESCHEQPLNDALTYIRQLESNYSQVSKALCGKENATLEEILLAVSQVKAELAAVKRERDALYCDLSTRADACDVCKHGCLYKYDCEELFGGDGCSFEWQGVCKENTEVQEDDC